MPKCSCLYVPCVSESESELHLTLQKQMDVWRLPGRCQAHLKLAVSAFRMLRWPACSMRCLLPRLPVVTTFPAAPPLLLMPKQGNARGSLSSIVAAHADSGGEEKRPPKSSVCVPPLSRCSFFLAAAIANLSVGDSTIEWRRVYVV